jgi:hypothetical protein
MTLKLYCARVADAPLAGQGLYDTIYQEDNVPIQKTQRPLNGLTALKAQFHFMEYPNRKHFFEAYRPAGDR